MRCPNGTRKKCKTGRCEPTCSTSKKRVISEYSGQKFKIKRSKRGNQPIFSKSDENELLIKAKYTRNLKQTRL